MLLAPAPDIIHLPAHLLEVIERVCVFDKYLVAIILESKVGQVYQAGIGGTADALLHGFGRIAEFAAQFIQSGFVHLSRTAGQIFHDSNNILAPDVTDDAQPLKHGGKGRGCLGESRCRIFGIPAWLGMEVFHEDILHLMQGSLHRHRRGDLLDHRLNLHAVDRLLDEEFNACLVGGRDHILGRYLREHDESSPIKERACFFYEGDAVHLWHQKIHDHDVRLQDAYVFQAFDAGASGAADDAQPPVCYN